LGREKKKEKRWFHFVRGGKKTGTVPVQRRYGSGKDEGGKEQVAQLSFLIQKPRPKGEVKEKGLIERKKRQLYLTLTWPVETATTLPGGSGQVGRLVRGVKNGPVKLGSDRRGKKRERFRGGGSRGATTGSGKTVVGLVKGSLVGEKDGDQQIGLSPNFSMMEKDVERCNS